MADPHVEVIDNRGPNTLKAALRKLAPGAKLVQVHVAFVSRAGLDLILGALLRARSVRLVTGLYQGITEPDALRELLRIQEQRAGRLLVRVSREPKLHRKLYLMDHGRTTKVVCGSSNLTLEGLNSPGELNLLVGLRSHDPALKSLTDGFQAAWSRRTSAELTKELIRRYEAARPKGVRTALSGSAIRSIVGAGAADARHHDGIGRTPTYWRDTIDDFVGKKTEKIIEQETDWDRRGYDWMSVGRRRHAIGDRILLLDRRRKINWARVVEVVDVTRTSTATPDGRYFTAYRALRRSGKRRIGETFWRHLASAGVTVKRSRRWISQHLTADRWNTVRASLNI